MSDNEDATASLGHSERLSVKNPVGDPIPELDQHAEKGSKRPSVVNRQDTGDVLPHHPYGAQSISKSSKLNGEVATRIIQARSFSGDGERLARCASGQKVDCSHIICSDPGEVAEVGNRGVVRQSNDVANGCRAAFRLFPVRRIVWAGHIQRTRCAITRAQQPATERIDLGKCDGCPAERLPSHGHGLDARTHGQVSHAALRGVGPRFCRQRSRRAARMCAIVVLRPYSTMSA